jgi:hypothetical protein
MPHDSIVAAVKSARDLENRALVISSAITTRKIAVNRLEAQIAEIKANQALLEKVKMVLSHLLESSSYKDLRGMDSLVSYGLRTVYPEKALEFKSEIVDTGKKISIEMSTYRSGRVSNKDQHGSVSVLESLLIRMLSILKMGSARLLIADEPFSAVGNEHINNIGVLLEELAKRLKMDILLVTHNPGVSDACMFRASLQAGDRLVLSKVGGPVESGKVLEVDASSVVTADAPAKKSPSRRKTVARKAATAGATE